jgi:hypothetical protein
MMKSKTVGNVLLGLLIGAVGGPLLAGLSGYLLLCLIWSGQWLAGAVDYSVAEIFVWAGVFAALIAPFGAFVGVIVGLIIGAFGRKFGSLANAGSFGGLIGATVGLFTAFPLFGVDQDLSSMVVAIIAFAISGLGVAIIIKKIQSRGQLAQQVR